MILQSPLDIFPSDGGLSTGDGALIDLVWLPKSQPNKLFERNKSNIGGERERERESERERAPTFTQFGETILRLPSMTIVIQIN